jgi:glycosyltransferase involved in cell wall biosynthesis
MLPQDSGSVQKTKEITLSIVVPCYNEKESLPGLVKALVPHLETSTAGAWELILVDDGSSDSTAALIAEEHRRDARICGVILTRNFGHQAAIFAGLSYASGQYIGIMDADLQDPPEVLIACLDKARTENFDLVYAVRQTRKAGLILKFSYWTFYRLMRLLAEYSWPLDAGDFSVFNRKVLLLIMQLPEHVRVLRGLRSWVGLRQGFIRYARPERSQGTTKYNLFKLAGLALNSLISFSNLPLRLASVIGLSMSVISVIIGLLLLANRLFPKFTLFGYYIGANPGVTTIVLLGLLVASLLFLCLGILGEYLGLLLKEIKRRPMAIVSKPLGDLTRQVKSGLILEASEADRD